MKDLGETAKRANLRAEGALSANLMGFGALAKPAGANPAKPEPEAEFFLKLKPTKMIWFYPLKHPAVLNFSRLPRWLSGKLSQRSFPTRQALVWLNPPRGGCAGLKAAKACAQVELHLVKPPREGGAGPDKHPDKPPEPVGNQTAEYRLKASALRVQPSFLKPFRSRPGGLKRGQPPGRAASMRKRGAFPHPAR